MERTYTLVAYKPSDSVTNCGRGCCGSTTTDSDHVFKRGLTLEELAAEIATLRIQYNPDLHREEYRGPPHEVKYFDDMGGPNWDWDDSLEEYFSDTGFGIIDQKLETLIAQQQPIIKQKQEREAQEAAEKAAAAEKIRREKYEAEQKERRDREEYARLKTKFETTPK